MPFFCQNATLFGTVMIDDGEPRPAQLATLAARWANRPLAQVIVVCQSATARDFEPMGEEIAKALYPNGTATVSSIQLTITQPPPPSPIVTLLFPG